VIEITMTGINIELGKQPSGPILIFTDRQSGIRVRVPLPEENARAVANGILSTISGVVIANGLREVAPARDPGK
jgi:hypothetical protein